MTVTVVLSDCPQKLRGDMTKWFVEINTGVYVGNLNSRVRDEVWDRITENIGHGHATMVFSTSGEQKIDFRVHNAYWEPVDFDGIKLMRRPESAVTSGTADLIKPGFSDASKRRMAKGRRKEAGGISGCFVSDYVVLDLETTGLDKRKDRIIEIAAIRIENGMITERMETLVRCDIPISPDIVRITGITEELMKGGKETEDALEELTEFAEDSPFVCHNAFFDKDFLTEAFRRLHMDAPDNRFIDTLQLAQRLIPNIGSYQLASLADYLNIPSTQHHRAMADCETTYGIYNKLNELASDMGRKNE